MIKEKLYATTIFAFKPDPEHQVIRHPDGHISTYHKSNSGENVYHTCIDFLPGYELAASFDEVIETLLAQSKEKWPESEGWILHRALAVEIDEGTILETATAIALDMQPQADELERVM